MWKWIKSKLLWFFVGGVALAAPMGLEIANTPIVYTVCDLQEERLNSIHKVLKEGKVREHPLALPRNLTATERANIKGCEIAKAATIGKVTRGTVEIEIVDIEPIDGGVQVFARAWKNGKQIGFGKDGTVDIERFRIFNPPILVEDPTGEVIQSFPADFKRGLEAFERRLREDSQEALLQVLEHNLSVMKNIHTDEKIVKGKRGNTTSTFYPDAGSPGTDTIDVYYESDSTRRTWADTVALTTAGGTVDATTASLGLAGYNYVSIAPAGWRALGRFRLGFLTSPLGSDTIDSATLSLYGFQILNTNNDVDANVYGSDLASHSATVENANDFDDVLSTAFSTAIDYSTWSTSGYNDYLFNTTGEEYIDPNGVSEFFIRSTLDATVTTPGTTAGNNYLRWYQVDQTGTANDPKLVVEHSAAASARRIILPQ